MIDVELSRSPFVRTRKSGWALAPRKNRFTLKNKRFLTSENSVASDVAQSSFPLCRLFSVPCGYSCRSCYTRRSQAACNVRGFVAADVRLVATTLQVRCVSNEVFTEETSTFDFCW